MTTSRLENYAEIFDSTWNIEQVINTKKRLQALASKRSIGQILEGISNRNVEKIPFVYLHQNH